MYTITVTVLSIYKNNRIVASLMHDHKICRCCSLFTGKTT